MAIDVDSNGWPTNVAVDAKLQTVAPGAWTPAIYDDITAARLSVIAEFQSPVPAGTGRSFTPVTETRYFDGNGYPELIVPDIVPGSALSITSFGISLSNVLLKTNFEGLGYNILSRQTGASFSLADLQYGVFLTGHQNIAVTTTWGYAAAVPVNIADAVACEVARRILTQTVAGVSGVGSTVKTEDTMTATGAGEIALRTSILIEWGERYQATKTAYTVSQGRKLRSLIRRMS